MKHDTPFRTRFKALREAIGVSQSEMAERLGVSQQSISFYEKGDRLPDYEVLDRIYKETGCSIKYLFGYQEDMSDDIDQFSKNNDIFREWGGVSERAVIAFLSLTGKEAAAMNALMIHSESFIKLLGALGILSGGEHERDFENQSFSSGYYDYLCFSLFSGAIRDVKKHGEDTLSETDRNEIKCRKQFLEYETAKKMLDQAEDDLAWEIEEYKYAKELPRILRKRAEGDKFEKFRTSLLFPEDSDDSLLEKMMKERDKYVQESS